jgi:hypothetical protein
MFENFDFNNESSARWLFQPGLRKAGNHPASGKYGKPSRISGTAAQPLQRVAKLSNSGMFV